MYYIVYKVLWECRNMKIRARCVDHVGGSLWMAGVQERSMCVDHVGGSLWMAGVQERSMGDNYLILWDWLFCLYLLLQGHLLL